ncbi:hypothetical protein [Dankookia sp. P2]|uniref:hypothetical protein n=1 Tax=Dankookia sp. P2 TaxID=3423955 RepID=UPI003D675993
MTSPTFAHLAPGPADYWVKVVGMLQQNWALRDVQADVVNILFVGDDSGVFDSLRVASPVEAERQLHHNGFRRFDPGSGDAEFLFPPAPPSGEGHHPNGAIYSSGRFWSSR